jgi:hypothetical protein
VKKSAAVRLTLMTSMTIVACRQGSGRQCVDWDGKVVNEALCSDTDRTPVPGTARAYYHWFYLGGSRGGAGVSGAPHAVGEGAGAHGSVSRGGFGSSAGAHGSSGGAGA